MLDPGADLQVRGRLQGYLRPGEEMLWSGRPDPAVLFAPGDTFFIPFSVVWLTFAVFWEAGVSGSGGGLLPELWGIPFIAIGLYAVAGRFIYKRFNKKRTGYGITRDRAIILAGNTVSDMPLRGVPTVIRRSRDGTHVSVTFADLAPWRDSSRMARRRRMYQSYANTGMEPLARGASLPFGFYDVADPAGLLAALTQAQGPAGW